MISSSLSIKILGCTFVIGMTIGIPVIAVKEHEKKEKAKQEAEVQKRQKEKDDPANITKFLNNLLSRVSGNEKSEITSVETFSKTAIAAWTPTPAEKTTIATNFSSITKHMPNEFFEKLQNKDLTKAQGVAHIKTFQTIINGQKKQLFIPFLIKPLTTWSQISRVDIRAKGNGAIEIHLGSKSKTELQNIAAGATANFSSGKKVDKTMAKDLLFLQKLYDDTIARLVTLGNIDQTKPNANLLWSYDY